MIDFSNNIVNVLNEFRTTWGIKSFCQTAGLGKLPYPSCKVRKATVKILTIK